MISEDGISVRLPLAQWASAAFVLVLATAMAGCAGAHTYRFQQTRAEHDALLSDLPVAGEWSVPIGGLRCRILASSTETFELGRVRVALEMENVGQDVVEFARTGHPPFSDVFALDNHALGWHTSLSPRPYMVHVRLEPGQRLALIKRDLTIEPDLHERTTGKLWAGPQLPGGSVTSPPIQLQVKPVEWGPTVGGLRMHIDSTAVEGRQVMLCISVHNLGNDRLLMPPWGEQSVERTGDGITMRFCNSENWVQTECGRGFLDSRHVALYVPEPGAYRVHVQLDVPTRWLSPRGETWAGNLVSNEIAINVPNPGE